MTDHDTPDPSDDPWGGDGSDIHEPVRAHVEADSVYSPPLDQLLSLGETETP